MDEFNPHLIWKLNDQESIRIIDHNEWAAERWSKLTGQPVPTTVGQLAKRCLPEFYDKYTRSLAAVASFESGIEGFIPLVYRLDILTKEAQKDVLDKDKLGGIPDLRKMLYGWCNSAYHNYHFALDHYGEEETKRRYPKGEPPIKTMAEGLRNIWPRCGCCGGWMRFIGQMDYSAWKHVIHLATGGPHPGFYNKVSAFGAMPDRPYVTSERQLFFYCPCHTLYNFNNDCLVIRDERSSIDWFDACEILEGNKEERKPLYTDAQYKRAVSAFMKRIGVHPDHMEEGIASAIPLQFITGFDLNFELDWHRASGNYDLFDFNDKIREAVPPQSGKYGSDFQLFGAPKSQQDPKRPMSFGGDHPLRMSPLLSWDDDGHDFTYQMYGDFRVTEHYKPVMCKYDGSCT